MLRFLPCTFMHFPFIFRHFPILNHSFSAVMRLRKTVQFCPKKDISEIECCSHFIQGLSYGQHNTISTQTNSIYPAWGKGEHPCPAQIPKNRCVS